MSLTYTQIGAELGTAESTACESATCGAAMDPTRGHDRAEESLTCQARPHRASPARRDDPRAHPCRSRPVVIMYDGKRVLDDGPGIQVATVLPRVQERRAKLLGLDVPVKHRVDVITEDVVDVEIKRLAKELSLNDRLVEVGLLPEDDDE